MLDAASVPIWPVSAHEAASGPGSGFSLFAVCCEATSLYWLITPISAVTALALQLRTPH